MRATRPDAARPGPAGPHRGVALLPVTLAYRGDDLEITFHEPVPHPEGDDGLVAMMQAWPTGSPRGSARTRRTGT